MAVYLPATSKVSSLTSLYSVGSLLSSGNKAQSNGKSTLPDQTIPTPESKAPDTFSHIAGSDFEQEAYVESQGEGSSEDDQQQTDDECREDYEPHDWKLEAECRLDAVQQLRSSLTTNYTRSVDRSNALHYYAQKDSSNADDAQAYLWQYRKDIPQLNKEGRDKLAEFEANMQRDWFYTQKGEVKWIAEEQEKLFGNWSLPNDDDTKASWPVDIGPKNEVVEVVTALPKELTKESLRQDSAISLRKINDGEMEPRPKKKPRLVIHLPEKR
jgi:hypothetical protein